MRFSELKIGQLFEADLWNGAAAEYNLACKIDPGTAMEIKTGVRHLMPDDYEVIPTER